MKFLLLALLLIPQEARELIEKLRSDQIEERDEAARKLKELGKPALRDLDQATKDKDPEVASRARQLIRVIRGVDQLTPSLTKLFPELEVRLGAGTDQDWTVAFLAALNVGLKKEDLEPLAARAVRGAATRSNAGSSGRPSPRSPRFSRTRTITFASPPRRCCGN